MKSEDWTDDDSDDESRGFANPPSSARALGGVAMRMERSHQKTQIDDRVWALQAAQGWSTVLKASLRLPLVLQTASPSDCSL